MSPCPPPEDVFGCSLNTERGLVTERNATYYRAAMHAVVNHPSLATPVDPGLWQRTQAEFGERLRAVHEYRGLRIVRMGGDHLIRLVFADDEASLDRIATEVGSPWVMENLGPHLAGPPQRQVGEVVVDL
jgi:hypothetical protein